MGVFRPSVMEEGAQALLASPMQGSPKSCAFLKDKQKMYPEYIEVAINRTSDCSKRERVQIVIACTALA